MEGRRGRLVPLEPGLTGVAVTPAVGVGQRAILVAAPAGTLLQDPTGYVDDALAEQVEAAGVQRLADRLAGLESDRLRDDVRGVVPVAADRRVQESADRYVRWVRGDHDDLT